MLLQPNAAFEFMANKLDSGIVTYKSLGRQFARDYVVPSNPSTSSQVSVRAAFAAATVAYSSLSAANKSGWAAAATLMPLRTDSLGRTYAWTGKALFVAVNSYRGLAAVALATTAPTELIALQPYMGTPAIVTTNLRLPLLIPGGATVDTNAWCVIRVSDPLPGTTRVAQRGDVRLIVASTEDCIFDTTPLGTVNADYPVANILAHLGYTPTVGQRIGVLLTPLTSDFVPGPESFFATQTIA